MPELVIYQGSDKPDHPLPGRGEFKSHGQTSRSTEVTRTRKPPLSADLLFPRAAQGPGQVVSSTDRPQFWEPPPGR